MTAVSTPVTDIYEYFTSKALFSGETGPGIPLIFSDGPDPALR